MRVEGSFDDCQRMVKGALGDAALQAEGPMNVSPHTATAIRVFERQRMAGDTRHWTIAATAHPAKFEAIVEPLIGRSVVVPEALGAHAGPRCECGTARCGRKDACGLVAALVSTLRLAKD